MGLDLSLNKTTRTWSALTSLSLYLSSRARHAVLIAVGQSVSWVSSQECTRFH